MRTGNMFIDGEWVAAQKGQTRTILNPFNAEPIAEVAEGSEVDSILAIEAARRAFDEGPWSEADTKEKAAKLKTLAELVRRDREELAELESLDTGKTVEESRWDMDDVAGIFDYYANLIDLEKEQKIDSPIADSQSTLIKEPVGVCGLILPWNYPLLQASWKMGPALAAGCSIVMKPSEITPLTTIKITELCEEAAFPNGVVNLVLGPGHSVGAKLADSHQVDLISFTGGIETGQKIMKAASGNIKKVALELGGKNPHMIFDDCDFDVALDYALNGVFFHAGQICSAGARLMVQEGIYQKFCDALKERVENIVIGNGFEPGTQMGPLISAEHREKVEDFVRKAKNEGATLLCGGKRPWHENLKSGYFFLPTLFVDCDESMEIVQKELFGPVISVESFKIEEEAIQKANNTTYGLSAGFWTQDKKRIKRVSRALKFGTVWANDFNVYFVQAPWGGYKQSGLGRELGKVGLEEYQEIKHVFENLEPKAFAWFK